MINLIVSFSAQNEYYVLRKEHPSATKDQLIAAAEKEIREQYPDAKIEKYNFIEQ